ncbi:signal peptidase I [Chrysiogenes arsenatis]|uniref:signal peptidase I n=1 Tax=Chrysiogenes arsenatis TaxID=309797 RepID=UPI0004126715|nr:signal peptidase I [Chrysiogenes arsenatis]
MSRFEQLKQKIELEYLDGIIAVFYLLAVLLWADEMPLKLGKSTVSIPMIIILLSLAIFHARVFFVWHWKKLRPSGKFYEAVQGISQTLAMALVIILFIAQAFKIPSGSMLETLQIGDHLLVNKFIHHFTGIDQGDIVVFKFPPDPSVDYIKRVVALPGDRVEIRAKELLVNGKPYHTGYEQFIDPMILRDARDFMPEFVVPEGHYFTLGDNRDNSFDGRFWGTVPEEAILGKAFIIYFSWDSEAGNVRLSRIGNLIR